jgi:hypothetical protein
VLVSTFVVNNLLRISSFASAEGCHRKAGHYALWNAARCWVSSEENNLIASGLSGNDHMTN